MRRPPWPLPKKKSLYVESKETAGRVCVDCQHYFECTDADLFWWEGDRAVRCGNFKKNNF